MALFLMLIIPLAYLIVSIFFAVKNRGSTAGRAAGISVICYFISLALGTVAILSSRGSTAAIGFVFLPYYSLAPAFIGYIHVVATKNWAKITTLILLVVYYGFIIQSTYLERVKNAQRDKSNQERSLQIQSNSQFLKDLIAKNPEQAKLWMEEKVRSSNDDTWLIPIAENKLATPELLIELSTKPNAPLLSIIRNPNVPASILEQTYRKSSYPDYYFADLAKQSNTPPDILLELYRLHRQKNSGIEKNLASNPNVPSQLIKELVSSNDPLVLGELARNPSIDCSVVLETHKKLIGLSPDTQFYSTGVGWAQAGYERCSQIK